MSSRKLSAVYDEQTVREVESLASEYDIPPQEVLRQLVDAGLEEAQSPL
ncbi:hypothetical protein [Halospeciosus flavus]|uniref:CopG family transcriptional regulator n=1 Tax=Halospeciosus flavus TaxID=3032283 RepID=A0ABD5Z7Y9_9EURY|nr:hypothetical protein [Halospeciosus flavus]